MNNDFIFELYCEEIPSRMQPLAKSYFLKEFSNLLIKFGIISDNVRGDILSIFVGPCRIVASVKNLPQTVELSVDEVRGPRKDGVSQAALEGFLKKNSIHGRSPTITDLITKISGKDEYYYLPAVTMNINIKDIFVNNIADIVLGMKWLKSMYWGSTKMLWIRPLRNVLCMLGKEVLNIQVEHLQANNTTYDHKFMKANAIVLSSASDYAHQFVIVSDDKRRAMISDGLRKVCESLDITLGIDDGLLSEVTGLVEYPSVLYGKIDDKFSVLPNDIIISSMRTHQRYFHTYNKDRSLSPYFLFVSNSTNTNAYPTIIHGNEKVLFARLSDALFFYNQDKSKKLEEYLQDLQMKVFHEQIGTMYDKTIRVVKICSFIDKSSIVDANVMELAQRSDLCRAAVLAKCDLCTLAVNEFPELQGIMGGHYAKLSRENEVVVQAICGQYNYTPTPENTNATTRLLLIAEAIDSIVSLYIAGERATSSKDPYGMRRIALTIIRAYEAGEHMIDLNALVSYAFSLHTVDSNATKDEVISFITERFKYYIQSEYGVQNYTADLLNSNIVYHIGYLKSLQLIQENAHDSIKLENIFALHKRITNIIDSGQSNGEVFLEELLTTNIEKMVYDSVQNADMKINLLAKDSNTLSYYEKVHQKNMSMLNIFDAIVNIMPEFFDNITVFSADINMTNNRVLLLKKILALLEQCTRSGGCDAYLEAFRILDQ